MTKKQKDFLEILEKTGIVISKASELLGIDRKNHYNWLKESPEYKEAFENLFIKVDDIVFTSAVELISGAKKTKTVTAEVLDKNGNKVTLVTTIEEKLPPDTAMIIYYFKTKGRRLGFTENNELTVHHDLIQAVPMTEESIKKYEEYLKTLNVKK